MGRHTVIPASELPAGSRLIVTLEGKSIGIFNVNGTYYALKNTCPHQQAPLCAGKVTGMTLPAAPGEYVYGREGEIIRCPWHGWEFDLTTGKSIFDPHRCLVKTYEVSVEQAESPSVDTFPVEVERGLIVVTVS